MPKLEMQEFTANGPTYPLLSWGLTRLHGLSAVERLKAAVIWATGARTPEEKRRVSNYVIDIFIVAKFVLVFAAWYLNWAGRVMAGAIAYLLVFNIYTYFWHHLWLPVAPAYALDNPYRERRRFFNLLLAMAFSMLAYAYFYHRVFNAHFDWPRDVYQPAAALTFSVGNALTGATGELHPRTSTAYLLMTSQLMMTFVFIAMLLSKSIPGQKHGQEDQNG